LSGRPERMGSVEPVEIDEPPRPSVVRSPEVRLLAFLAAMLVVVAVALAGFAPSGLSGFERDLLRALGRLPRWLSSLLVVVSQFLAAYAPFVVIAVLLLARRWRRLLNLLGSFSAAVLVTEVLLSGLFKDDAARAGVRQLIEQRLRIPSGFPSSGYVAGVVALVVVESPWLERRWRRVFRTAVALVVVARLISASALPRDVLLAVALGLLVGYVGLMIAGSPDREPRGADVATVLADLGLEVVRVQAVATGSRGRWLVTVGDGGRLSVRVISIDSRIARLPGRLYRSIRLRNLGSERPWASVEQLAEHEALASLKASGDGVPTPRLRAIGPIGDRSMLLAFDHLEGRALDGDDPDGGTSALDDPTMREIWHIVEALRVSRVAHRRLTLDRFVRDGDGHLAVTDFAGAEVGAGAGLMANDVAELLVALAHRVGAEVAVGSAIDVLGPEAVGESLARLQPLAFSRATRRDAKEGDLLRQVFDEVRRRTGIEQVEQVELERLSLRTVLLIVFGAAALYVIAPQLSGTTNLWSNVRDANWAWFAVALVASAVTYVGAAVGIDGSVPAMVPFGTNLLTQLAGSFVGLAAPAQLGGMTLNVRFLQRSGVDAPVAVASVGLNAVTGVVVHVALLIGFAFWTGSGGLGTIRWPSLVTILIAVAILAMALALLVAIPAGRRLIAKIVPFLRNARGGLAEVAKQPAKLVKLIGGAGILTLGCIIALAVCVAAVHGHASFASIGFVYLTASVVASAAPTPGGLGAVEATLIAGLHTAGIESSIAVGAVLLYRLATFWLPIAPGFLAFRHLDPGRRPGVT